MLSVGPSELCLTIGGNEHLKPKPKSPQKGSSGLRSEGVSHPSLSHRTIQWPPCMEASKFIMSLHSYFFFSQVYLLQSIICGRWTLPRWVLLGTQSSSKHHICKTGDKHSLNVTLRASRKDFHLLSATARCACVSTFPVQRVSCAFNLHQRLNDNAIYSFPVQELQSKYE